MDAGFLGGGFSHKRSRYAKAYKRGEEGLDVETSIPHIQRLAESLLGRIDEKVVDRLSRLSLGLEMAGRPDEGQTLFVNYCAPCHRVGDVGKDIGPDLLSVSSRSPREFLVGLIDPNRAVEGRYLQHEIRTVSGELWVGLLKENSSEATVLIDPLGMERVIANRDIVSQGNCPNHLCLRLGRSL